MAHTNHPNHLHQDGHGHEHGHHHPDNNSRRVFFALLLTGGFMLAEVIGGVLSGSLALLADAAHMLTDTISLLLAWFAFRWSKKLADGERTYGYHRFPVLAAYTNGISLLFIVGWIFVEAIDRFFNPTEVAGGPMLVVATLGLVVNIVAFIMLHGADRTNLNIRGALLHVLGDLLGSVAAIVAAVVILSVGWMPIDPLLSIFVALLVLYSAWPLVKESGHVLLEGVPAQLNVNEVGPDLIANVPVIQDVHHVHAWSLSQDQPLLTLHARLSPDADPDVATAQIKERLVERFSISHITVQVEIDACTD